MRVLAYVLLIVLPFAPAAFAKAGLEERFEAYLNLNRDFRHLTETKKIKEFENYTLHRFRLTSSAWKQNEVKPGHWEHWLLVRVPRRVLHPGLFLYVSNGRFEDSLPEALHRIPDTMSEKAGVVSAELRMVPEQPLTFLPDGMPRTEDGIIAYSWKKFFETADPEWIAQGPMVVAVREAMDFLEENSGHWPGVKSGGFILSGQSKRAWTSWLTAARDQRVRALIPFVFDLLNIEVNLRHHHQMLGFWAPALKDYVEQGIPDHLGTQKFRDLASLVDPYSVREKLTVPKYLVNAANDEFFLPDSSRFYFAGLPGDKGLRYVPNTGHGIDSSGTDFIADALGALKRILAQKPLNVLSWAQKGQNLLIESREKPSSLAWWEARSPVRDFRKGEKAPVYIKQVFKTQHPSRFTLPLKPPPSGWSAGFLEACYPSSGDGNFCLTTDVFVSGT